MQKPTISVGTELSIGTVVAIRNDGVIIERGETQFPASFAAVEKVYEDDQNAQTTR
jgi:hypothetical protein